MIKILNFQASKSDFQSKWICCYSSTAAAEFIIEVLAANPDELPRETSLLILRGIFVKPPWRWVYIMNERWKLKLCRLSTWREAGHAPLTIRWIFMNFYEFLMLPRRRRTSESQSNLNSPHNEQTTFPMALRPNQTYINTSLTFLVLLPRQKFICFRSSKRYAKGESLQMASDL